LTTSARASERSAAGRFRSAVLLISLIVSVLAVACRPRPGAGGKDTYVFEGTVFGTYYVIKLVEPATGKLAEARQLLLREAIEAELDDVDRKLSTYLENSEISLFNDAPAAEPFVFSEETFEVLQAALELSSKTAGAFDPTIGPLVNALGFGPPGTAPRAEPEKAIALARAAVGFTKLEIDPKSRAVRKTVPGMRIDLSAIGEGHAIDRLVNFLRKEGFDSLLVEIGGEVRTLGATAEGQAWRIGVERPQVERGSVQRIVTVGEGAVATSGDYRKYREENGVRLSHIIDARSGTSVRHHLASATVLATSCRFADAWATALMVLGPDEGFALAEREGLAVLLLVRDGDRFVERQTVAFENWSSPSR
jgi:FAD:protein FMN transferase